MGHDRGRALREPAHHLDRVVFEVCGRRCTWLDVVLAADARGEWPHFEAMAAAGLAADAALASEADVEKALTDFRRQRALTAGDDAERWLARFDLSPAAWRAAIRRTLLRARQGERAVAQGAAPSVFASALRPEVWWPEAVVSGALEEWARRAAEDLALVEPEAAPSPVPAPDTPIEPPAPATSWLSAWPGSWARRAELAAVAARARAIEQAVVTPEAVRSQLAAHPIDWTWLAIELATFRSEGAAREALLCLRLDGEPLADVGRRSGATIHTLTCRMEDLPDALRVPCLGVRVDEVVGPVSWADGFTVLRVAQRRPPAPEDPAAASRARDAIVSQLRERVARERVRFLDLVDVR